MNKLLATLYSGALLSVSVTAIAMDDMKDDAMNGHLKMMDSNHDGMISKTEFMNHHAAMWDKLKKNKDGMVMMSDMKMMDMGMMSPAADSGPKVAAHKTGEYIEDSALTTKVKTALMSSKNLKSLHISVESTEGVVTLSGTVPSEAQISQAGEVAKHVKGVTDVHNTLELKVAS